MELNVINNADYPDDSKNEYENIQLLKNYKPPKEISF